MANPKIETLIDSFSAAAINTGFWNNITGGAATLDAVNDLVTLAVPTSSGVNVFGTTSLYDATGSSIYAQIGVAANGNGNTKTIMRVRLDSSNAMTMRVESGIFKQVNVTGGVSTTVTLPTYDPHQHRYWRLRESGGTFYADTSPDGLTWTNQSSMAYTWAATAVTFQIESQASATEVAGNVSVISNINTRAGGQYNTNWPLIDDGWAPFWNANGGTMPIDRFVDVTNRTRNTVSISRGRQYELDQVRSGEASLALANTDGVLDPVNSAGPYFGHIQPYQPYKRRAQWPPTRNLLTQVQATGGDLGGYSTGAIPQSAAGPDIFSLSDSNGGSIVASATAWQGGSVLQFSVPSATATQTAIGFTRQPPVEPGATYTVQLRVRNVTASTSLQVDAFIVFADVAGTTTTLRSSAVTLTGSTTAAWTLVTVSGTAPANTARASCGVETAAGAAATCSVQVDGWQWERGSTASAWTPPGVVYPVYAGWTERWTPSWDMAGTYGLVSPTMVDAFSLLSQQQLSDPLTQEINSNSPRFVYRLDDPSGSTSAADWTGNNPAAQLGISKYGAGSWVFGNSITATDSTGIYTGGTGTVVTISNSNPGTALTSGGATFLKLSSAGVVGPADVSAWTRMIAFRYTGPTPTSSAVFWSGFDRQRSGGLPSGSELYWQIGGDGKCGIVLRGPTLGGGGVIFAPGPTVVDGDWHLMLAAYSRADGQVRIHVDGVTYTYSGIGTDVEPSGMISDNVGAWVDPTVGNGTTFNYKGDISFVAEFPSYMSSTAMANLYQAWKSSCSGESSNARYARILRYAGYSGVSSLQTGLTTSMGPAVFDGQDAMSALQSVVDTENGAHFIDRAGAVQFKARSNRYNALTPVYTFGENATAGELPYEDCQLDFDSTHLSNQVTVTQESTSQNFYATDATSISNYFPRTLSRTINSSSTNECQDAANYLLSRYKQSAMRVSSLKLHPSANPALWPVCLNLELGTRVRVMRRPPGVPATQVDCFVENIQCDWGDDNECFYTLQCSPADLTPYAIFSSWHTTLTSSIASGVTSITVNASADNTNPLAAQLASGDQIVLGQNTANQETVTVSAVGATSSGWTTATITLTAATTKSHTAGDIVCEPLPTGVTDPTTYDAVSKFDSSAFAY